MFLRSIHHHFLGVPNLEYLYGDWPNTMLKTPLPLHGMEDHKPDITFFEHTCEQCSYDVILKILIYFFHLYPVDPHFCDDSALFFSDSYPPENSHMACWRIHPVNISHISNAIYESMVDICAIDRQAASEGTFTYVNGDDAWHGDVLCEVSWILNFFFWLESA